jgi:hypothetical protein
MPHAMRTLLRAPRSSGLHKVPIVEVAEFVVGLTRESNLVDTPRKYPQISL